MAQVRQSGVRGACMQSGLRLTYTLLICILSLWVVWSTEVAHSKNPEGFPHGVAAGEVTAGTAVLWTRTDREALVRLEVSTHHALAGRNLFQQIFQATAATDFVVKASLAGLAP